MDREQLNIKRIGLARVNCLRTFVKVARIQAALLAMLTLTLLAPALASDNKGTVELGFDFGLESETANDAFGRSSSNSEFPIRLRIGTFLSDRTQVETHLNLGLFTGDFEIGGSLGFTQHFEFEPGQIAPYLGVFGTMNRRQTFSGDREQFGLGFKIGVKTLDNRFAPRFEIFGLRRFKNIDFQTATTIGINIGFSVFFKSNSPWDK